MEREEFERTLQENWKTLGAIREAAHKLHADVNQHYDGTKPYSVHLDMVADAVLRYGHEVCARSEDVVPMLFGAYFHDSMEDARLTYNNVLRVARGFLDEERALMAAEIVYALTNEKGRNRAERANDKYYAGIRATAYAPTMKLADRLANMTYSCSAETPSNSRMRAVYTSEMDHFLESISPQPGDVPDMRLTPAPGMLEEIKKLCVK